MDTKRKERIGLYDYFLPSPFIINAVFPPKSFGSDTTLPTKHGIKMGSIVISSLLQNSLNGKLSRLKQLFRFFDSKRIDVVGKRLAGLILNDSPNIWCRQSQLFRNHYR